MPETALPQYDPERCTGCGVCLAVCPGGGLALEEGRATFSAPENCLYCGECELACPAGAVQLYYVIVQGDRMSA